VAISRRDLPRRLGGRRLHRCMHHVYDTLVSAIPRRHMPSD